MAEHGELDTYRSKRDRSRTPEPVPEEGPLPTGGDDTFVIQEHHARRLHWDFRLERGGVLVSWALPKGLPDDPKVNHLAVHTEDHPLEYAAFAGSIPAGEYGGGSVTIWDRGTYECEKWTDDEVKVVLHGTRADGRYVLFRTGRGSGGSESRAPSRRDDEKSWMIHRMDAPTDPTAEPLPELVPPMLATAGDLPVGEQWSFEMKWDGVRAVAYLDRGSLRLMTRNDREVSTSYPELRRLGEALGEHRAVLDGEIVALVDGRPSFSALQQRMHVQRPTSALQATVPVTYLAFDLLWLDGHSTTGASYDERRSVLESLGLAGEHWAVPPAFPGDGVTALAVSKEQGLEGVVAKRRAAPYEPGRRSRAWVKVKHERMQEVIVGGWKPGAGRRAGTIGSLLLGVPADPTTPNGAAGGLAYVGHVGTGFSDRVLDDLRARLAELQTQTSPFGGESPVPREHARDAVWVRPELVGEVVFTEWTPDGRLRHPSWRGLRPDKSPAEVHRES
ncbi:MAG: non-homologous end-joining DNA ligase [Actinomycetales bacterium]